MTEPTVRGRTKNLEQLRQSCMEERYWMVRNCPRKPYPFDNEFLREEDRLRWLALVCFQSGLAR